MDAPAAVACAHRHGERRNARVDDASDAPREQRPAPPRSPRRAIADDADSSMSLKTLCGRPTPPSGCCSRLLLVEWDCNGPAMRFCRMVAQLRVVHAHAADELERRAKRANESAWRPSRK